jgi:hypothetical protein
VAVMRVAKLQEQTQDLRFPELLLLVGIVLILLVLSTSIRPVSHRFKMDDSPYNWMSQGQAQQLLAYSLKDDTRDKLALNSAAYSGTVTVGGGDQSPVEQLRVQKLERVVESGNTPWHGVPMVGERTTQSLPYVSP